MKRILRDTCLLGGLMILTVFTVSIVWSGVTAEILLVFQLFALSLLISVVNYLMDERISMGILAAYIVKYFLVSGIVIIFGFVSGWFIPGNFWMAFIYVGLVYLAAYYLDMIVIRRDIADINEMIDKRKNTNTETFVDK